MTKRGPYRRRKRKTKGTSLALYDDACRKLAKAVRVDEVMAIRDEAAQLAAAARVAGNHKAEADARAIRMRATRRLGQLMQAQKESVGFNRGAAAGGKKSGPRGSLTNPRDFRPTLASQGINKHLAHQARVLSAPSDKNFEKAVADTHDKVARAVRNAVREIEIEQGRESYRVERAKAGKKTTARHVTDDVQRNAETKVSEQPKPLTAEDLLALRRRHLIDLIIDVARQLPSDRSIEETRAVVASADAEGRRDSFALAVTTLGDLVDELRRALNERLIEAPAPPTLRLVPGKGD